MGIAFYNAQVAGVNSASAITITKPTGTQAGDFLFAAISFMSTGIVTQPSGWNQLTVLNDGHVFAWKVAGAAEPANYQWTTTGVTDPISGVIAGYHGIKKVNPIHSEGDASNGVLPGPTTVNWPARAVGRTGSLVIAGLSFQTGDRGNPPIPFSGIPTPAGYTLRANNAHLFDGMYTVAFIADKIVGLGTEDPPDVSVTHTGAAYVTGLAQTASILPTQPQQSVL